MGKEVYIGNLPYQISQEELIELFEPFGKVVSARVAIDSKTQQSRGFGFVEMESEQEAKKAVEALSGSSVGGRDIVVNEARPHKPRSFDQRSNNHRSYGERSYGDRSYGQKGRRSDNNRHHNNNFNNRVKKP